MPRGSTERAEALAVGGHRLRAGLRERGHAHVANPPIVRRPPLHLGEQPAEPVLVGRLVAHPARRHRTRPAAQRVDLDAAVVGEGRETGRGADRDRLGERRFRVAGPGLVEHARGSRRRRATGDRSGHRLRRPRSSLSLPGLRVARTRTGPLTFAPLSTSAWSANSCVRPGTGEAEERIQLLARERLLLRGSLQLDEPAVERSDAVHVGLGRRVLEVAEVEPRPRPPTMPALTAATGQRSGSERTTRASRSRATASASAT